MEDFIRESKFSPQVKIYFKEPFNVQTHVNGLLQKRAEISFRVVGETPATMNQTKARVLANRIKNEFFTPLITWRKGKYKVKYLDLENGFDFRVFAVSKAEGADLIRSAISSAGKNYVASNLEFIDHDRNYPNTTETTLIYGSRSRKPTRRPTVSVRPTHAQMLLNGRVAPINLVALSPFVRNALVYV
ncbi:hypothetical protein [Nodularia sphaerocarpa]|nr:hypothetical protein [Nodularia sphaerocarpa]MDB9372797.1 hypothetical protein [Nodularia sphaerocarpa CS-585]